MGWSLASIDVDAFERFMGQGASYCPSDLHPKQREFLALDCLEALYGGAAGGGKSEALLSAALQYAHVPKYAALILRRTYQDLALPDALMARAHEWLDDTDAHWDPETHSWEFPSGAVLQFGYWDAERHRGRYKSSAYQFIAVDELTEWPDEWYTFLFSRLRRLEGSRVPVRVRAATNPDGVGQEWVRQRFGIPIDATPNEPIWCNEGRRCFLPARAEDNPSLDLATYDLALRELGQARYEQLRWGKWRRDVDGLVYELDDALNIIDELPELEVFTLGIDYGARNACSWHVWGWRPHDPALYGVLTIKKTKVTPSEAAEMTHGLNEHYRFRRIVGDVGGLGRGYADETIARFRIPVEPAQKSNKLGYIRLYNGDLRAGRIKLHRTGCAPLIEEQRKLPWDKGKEQEAPGFENHACDASLYSWRDAYAYQAKELPAAKSPEEQLRDEQRAIWARVERKVGRAKSAAWYKR